MSTPKPTPPKAARRPAKAEPEANRPSPSQIREAMPFTPENYRYLLVGIVILVVGFMLLSIEDFIDATQFSIALYVAPFVIVGGYVFLIWAIMKRSANGRAADSANT
jgi:hypothetical protein